MQCCTSFLLLLPVALVSSSSWTPSFLLSSSSFCSLSSHTTKQIKFKFKYVACCFQPVKSWRKSGLPTKGFGVLWGWLNEICPRRYLIDALALSLVEGPCWFYWFKLPEMIGLRYSASMPVNIFQVLFKRNVFNLINTFPPWGKDFFIISRYNAGKRERAMKLHTFRMFSFYRNHVEPYFLVKPSTF